jgi:4-amino-4-deoxy-L-arabinose transferase-like glycosyltransferase
MSRRRAAPPPARPRRAWFALHAPAALDPAHARGFEWATLAVVAVLALVLAAIALGPHRVGDYFTETDFYGAYAEGARAIQHGRLDPSRYGVIGPLYEVVLALAGFVIRDLLTAAELISVACTTLAVWLWARLLAARVDARLGLAAAAFLAVNPTLLRYGFSATTDALALALQAACLLVLLTRGGGRAAAAAGLLGALAFLTRYNAIVLLPAGLVAILAGGTRFERRGAAALAFAAGFAAPVLPWIAFSLANGGSFASQLHHNIAYDVFARGRGITWDGYQSDLQSQFHSLGDVLARDPGAVIARQFANVGEHLARDARELLRSARSGRLQVHVDVTSLTRFGHQLDGAANRLTVGVVTAALIIGSSIVMTVEGGPTLLGLPLFGLLGFLGASVGGAWLLLSIWRSGRDG